MPESTETLILNLSERIILYLQNISVKHCALIKDKLFDAANAKGLFWSQSTMFLANVEPYDDADSGLVLLYEDATYNASENENQIPYLNTLQVIFFFINLL